MWYHNQPKKLPNRVNSNWFHEVASLIFVFALFLSTPFSSGVAKADIDWSPSCFQGSLPAYDGFTNQFVGCISFGIYADYVPSFPSFSASGNPQSIPMPPNVDPESDIGVDNAEDSHGQPKCGNPIDMSSGNKYQREVDFVGEGTLPLTIVRHYNSLTAIDTNELFGTQQSNFSERLSDYEETGSGTSAVRTIVVHNGTGSRIELTQTGTEHWQRRNGKKELLSRDDEGYWYFVDKNLLKVFHPTGELQSVTDEYGESHVYEYSSSNRLTQIVHSSGRRLAFFYNSSGHISKILDPANNSYDYGYWGVNLKTVKYPAGVDGIRPTKTYHYSTYNLERIVDEEGRNFANYVYGSFGRALESYHGEPGDNIEYVGRTVSQGGTVELTNALGKQTDFTFQEIAGKRRVTQVAGLQKGTCLAANRYHYYDSRGYKNSEIDWENNITDYVYDEFGHLRSVTRGRVMGPPTTTPLRTTTYEWNTSIDKPSRITTPLLDTTFTFDDSGRPLSISMKNTSQYGIANQTRTTDFSYTFYASGILKSRTINGPRTDVNDTTTLNYDANGLLSSISNALGHVTTYSNYDAYGRVGKITFPAGLVREFTYHPRGWLLTTRDQVDGQWRTTSYEYNKIGMPKRAIRPDGSTISFYYDAARRLTKVVDSNNHAKTYAFDKASNITSETIAELITTTTYEIIWNWGEPQIVPITTTEEVPVRTDNYEYDALSRLTKVITGAGDSSEYKYNKNNLVAERYDGKGSRKRSFYSPHNEVYYQYARDNGIVIPAFDNEGRLIRMRDAIGGTTHYQRDGFGQVWRVDSPSTGVSTYVYDAAGNVTSMTDARGVTTTRTYDALNRLLTSTAGSDTTESFQYDTGKKGFLYRLVDSAGTHTYTHNQAGELRQKTTTFAGQTLTTAYTYDTSGRVDTLTYPSGWKADYDYDAVGKVAQIRMLKSGYATKTVVDNVEYRPMGPVAGLTYGNGETRVFTRDLSYRPTSITSGNHFLKNYAYDANGNITTVSDQLASTNSRTLDYDVMDRLDYSDGPRGLWEYGYNKNGDRLWSKEDGAQVTYSYSSAKLTSRSGNGVSEARTYSASGQTTVIDNREFLYNDNNRFHEYKENGVLQSVYRYDAFGARGYKSIGADNYWFVYGGPNLLHERRNSQLRDYVYLNGEVVGMMYNNNLYYVHGDHLGRPEVVTNSAKAKVWQAANDDFHNTPTIDSIGGFNIGFPGQYYDVENGMQYNYFRTYDDSIGRYLQSDPIGLDDGLNTYSYVKGNPLSYVDPFGLKSGLVRPGPRPPGSRPTRNQKELQRLLEHIQYNNQRAQIERAQAKARKRLRQAEQIRQHEQRILENGDGIREAERARQEGAEELVERLPRIEPSNVMDDLRKMTDILFGTVTLEMSCQAIPDVPHDIGPIR